ncbi:MAG TPA: hypothetical protein PLD20_00960 [Blastocatellia bacterium]|nr:hypothetical protein [Blastocatellia bacterium]HMV81817.1 hypothetical protein [Blastocatellia bacterium]HMX24002.1 hypothetical protein [Blastocatellia bacterium]HMY70432.1 hypothetical protein [Blastocatellia bacterium]HMZ16505.1 hypothetical protein [Blastocatellia bacterium]
MARVTEGIYELAFKHGSFHDFETGLTINREDQVEVKEPIGAATGIAIQSGRLLFVREPKPASKAKKSGEGEGGEQK